jgi:hypothetical protein
MKNSILCLLSLAVLLLAAACHRNDIRTEIFPIEQMRNPESVQLLSKALQPLGGVKKITPNFEDRQLIVVFDGLILYKKNIEYAIVKAGFSLPYWPATPADKAKLPEELQ